MSKFRRQLMMKADKYIKFKDSVAEVICVPNDSVESYKTAENWSAYASKIKPISEYKEETT